jgi:hypothetical protein
MCGTVQSTLRNRSAIELLVLDSNSGHPKYNRLTQVGRMDRDRRTGHAHFYQCVQVQYGTMIAPLPDLAQLSFDIFSWYAPMADAAGRGEVGTLQ